MCLLAVSSDGNWLAASGTSAGVHVYNIKHLKVSIAFSSSKQEEVSPAVKRLKTVGYDWNIFGLLSLTENFSYFPCLEPKNYIVCNIKVSPWE